MGDLSPVSEPAPLEEDITAGDSLNLTGLGTPADGGNTEREACRERERERERNVLYDEAVTEIS